MKTWTFLRAGRTNSPPCNWTFCLKYHGGTLTFLPLRDESDTDYDELSDGEISKLLIVTQTPVRPRKHEGYDRTGDYTSRAQMSQDLAAAINDGLFYYEQDLWRDDEHDDDDDSWVSNAFFRSFREPF